MKNKFNVVKFEKRLKRDFLTIIIPVYKDPKGISKTLKSLEKQKFDKKKYEIIVANDGADKKTQEKCKKFGVNIVNISKNKGSYNARNEALKKARGEYIAFTDADLKVSKNWLSTGYEQLQKYDYVGGKIEIDEKQLKDLANYYEYLVAFDNKKKFEEYNYIPTANLFVKREVIKELGGFDGRLRSGGDAEFGDRVYRSGKYKMGCNPELIVTHPPRDIEGIKKKYVRTQRGNLDLAYYYPGRFSNRSSYIKEFFTPLYKVLFSEREVDSIIELKLFFYCLYIGGANVSNLFKLKNEKRKED